MKRSPMPSRTKPMKRSELKRGPGPKRRREPLHAASRKRPGISPASKEQRAKVRDAVSIVSGQPGCDPAHLVDRSLGGCDDPLCVVPLTRTEHRAFEAGELDLVPHLLRADCIAEMQHALGHLRSPFRLIHKLSGVQVG